MEKLFSLGEIYVSDFLKPDEFATPDQLHELELVMDESIGAARLKTTKPLNSMFGKYWYSSGTNESMKEALFDIVDSIIPLVDKKGNNKDLTWLDIACNDGTLLGYVPERFWRVGVDPCESRIIDNARRSADLIHNTYFERRLFPKQFKAHVVTTIAMFYDLEDPDRFIKDVYDILDDEGLWVLQLSYTPLMIKQMAFDNILSEHVYYHNFCSMKELMQRNGLDIVDCTLNDVNGGSMRLFVRKLHANKSNFGTQPYRDVCDWRMSGLFYLEFNSGANDPESWKFFYKEILTLKARIVEFITHAKSRGKTIMGYGASTKGNTLLQFFGLDNTFIDAIAERQECKWGLRTIGSNIPIISEEEMRERNPDYLLVLPWHFISEFQEREKEWHDKGGKWIVPCPKFEVI